MPITKSAQKALRQNKKRRIKNILRKKKIRGLVKEANSFVENKEGGKAKELIPQIYKALDKAAKRGVIKKGTANRRKSRIAKRIGKSDLPK